MTDSRHPTERDLLNFAREELGERRKQKILQHCKRCQECADRLLEAVREHAPPPGPIKLSWWNWASIVLFVVLLIALIGGFVWFLRSVPEAPGLDPEIGAPQGERAPPSAHPLDEGRPLSARPSPS